MSCIVSIITRTKDRPHLLRRAFSSVQQQGFTDWEHIVVNDGGHAAAVDAVMREFPDSVQERIKVLHHKEPKGMQAASNAGIHASSGTFICIHDDDDQWHPDYLSRVTAFLESAGERSPYQGVITATEEVRESIDASGSITEIERRPYVPLGEISLFRLGYENPFPPIAFCFRRSAWEGLGGFDPRWDVIGDMEFNLRFLRKFEIGVIPEPLAYYHIRETAADPASANSIREKQALHKRLVNELKNAHLKEAGTPGDEAVSLALNTAGYLVEAQWILHDVFHRLRQNEESLATLSRSIALEGYEDRFATLREALAILVDHARDTGMRSEVSSLREEMGEQVKAREALGKRMEELIASAGLPDEGDGFATVRQALNILVDHARSPQVADQLAHIRDQLQEAARNRHKVADRLEELIRSVGLAPKDNAPAHDTVLNKLTQLVDFTRDPSRNGEAAKRELIQSLESGAQQGREHAAQLDSVKAQLDSVKEQLGKMETRLGKIEQSMDASRRKFWEIRIGRFSFSASSERRNEET